MKLQPLHDWVLIRTGKPSDKSHGGVSGLSGLSGLSRLSDQTDRTDQIDQRDHYFVLVPMASFSRTGKSRRMGPAGLF